MNNFIPETGVKFYVKCKPRIQQIVVDDGFMAQKVETVVKQDNSFSDMIFECSVADSNALFAKAIYGGYGSKNRAYMFKIENYEFSPVGPEVMEFVENLPKDN